MANTKITTNVIADDAITGAKIADDAINSEHYTDGSIDTAHIADDQVTLAKMAGIARGKIIYGDSSGNPAVLAVGSNGQVLKSDGTDISWGTDSSNDRDGAAVFNESGAAVDFRIEGDTATNLFFVDGSADKIGINTSSPGAWLEVKDDGSLGHDMVLIQGGGSSGDYNAIAVKANNGNELFKVNASSYHTYLPNGSCKLGIGMASGAGHSLEVAGDIDFSKAGDGNNPVLHVRDTADTEVAWFEGNRAGDTGAFISLWHKPSSAAGTNRSGIKFQAPDAGNNKTQYAMMMMEIDSNTEGSEDGQLGFHLIDDGSINEILTIKKDRLLYKGRSGSAFIRADNRADGHDTGFEIYQNGSRKWEIHSDDSNTDALDIRNNGGTQRFTFTQDGELGIGNTNPGGMHSMVNRLVVGSGSGNQGLAIYSGAGSEGAIGFARDIAANTDAYDGLIEYSQGDRSFRFGTNAGTERMRLKTGLSIGSATDPGSQNLLVAGVIKVGTNSPALGGLVSIQDGNPGVPALFVYNTNADSVGIRSQVNSNASSNYIYYAVNSGGGVWQIRNDGDHQGTDTSIGSLSDSRLKKDVTDLTYDIAKFKQYRPIEFNWINPELHRSASGKSRGFLAQEVKALDDYYVDKYEAEGDDKPLVDEDGMAHSTKFGYKDAMYISVIKQLITRLEAAEAKITALEG